MTPSRLAPGKAAIRWSMLSPTMSRVVRAVECDETTGFMKVIVSAETDRILGASVLSSEGGELVQILGAVMMAGAPYAVLKGAVYIHPTLAEGPFGLMESLKPVQ